MNIENATQFEIETEPFTLPDGQTVLTIIVKGTFDVRADNKASVAAEQLPILFADEMNEGGSVRFASDMLPVKPRADVVLVGAAHAPQHTPVAALDVSLHVGGLRKTVRVFGDRVWHVSEFLGHVAHSAPVPFATLDLSYERAFGGVDKDGGAVCEANPVGRGYFAEKDKKNMIAEHALPNLEHPAHLVKHWNDHPPPVGFGFISASWKQRAELLGTYDARWQHERSPRPPEDFKLDFYNSAPRDQQIEGYLRGDEAVELAHVTPDGVLRFQLPGVTPRVTVIETDAYAMSQANSARPSPGAAHKTEKTLAMNLDTLCLLPEERRLYLVWRGCHPVADMRALDVETIRVTQQTSFRVP